MTVPCLCLLLGTVYILVLILDNKERPLPPQTHTLPDDFPRMEIREPCLEDRDIAKELCNGYCGAQDLVYDPLACSSNELIPPPPEQCLRETLSISNDGNIMTKTTIDEDGDVMTSYYFMF